MPLNLSAANRQPTPTIVPDNSSDFGAQLNNFPTIEALPDANPIVPPIDAIAPTPTTHENHPQASRSTWCQRHAVQANCATAPLVSNSLHVIPLTLLAKD
ncbi:MAG: hypothetical protein ACRC2T_11365 [Thermoguttaceae bacterium]